MIPDPLPLPLKIFPKCSLHKKCRIRETLNLLTFADSSTNIKTDRDGQKGENKLMCHVSYIMFLVSCGQTFCDLHTRLNLFQLFSHNIKPARCSFHQIGPWAALV